MDESLTIEYASSRREVWRAYWDAGGHGRPLEGAQRLGAAFAFSLALTISSGWALPGIDDLAEAVITALLAVAWMPLYTLLRVKRAKRILRVDQQGLTTRIGRKSAARTWPDIDRIERMPSGEILVITRKASMFVI